MNSNRKTAIIVGVLFLTAMATSMIGDGLIKSILNAPNYLANVYSNKNQVIFGSLLWIINSASVIGIAVLLYPILKKENEPIALCYIGFRIIESVAFIIAVISLLLLITLSQEYIIAGTPGNSYYLTISTLVIKINYFTLLVAMIFLGICSILFCYVLYQSKLIPRLISAVGFIGYTLMLIAALLDLFGIVNTFQGAGLIYVCSRKLI